MVPPNYVSSLIAFAEGQGEPVGSQKLRDFHAELFDQISSGDGTKIVSSNVNGRAFTFQVTMTVEEQFAAVGQAIKALSSDAKDSPFTFPDFSEMC